MSSIYAILQLVHKNVHSLPMKNFNEPKIYTGGVDIEHWNDLSRAQKKKALDKRWYLYYSFRNPETGKMVRQPNISMNVNRMKTKTERMEFLNGLKIQLKLVLETGYNPYKVNQDLYDHLIQLDKSKESSARQNVDVDGVTHTDKEDDSQLQYQSINHTFDEALLQKQAVMNNTSYSRFKSRIKKFRLWLTEKYDLDQTDINSVSKSDVIKYLSEVLLRTSSRNRNNTRTDLNSLFQVMEDNEMIADNFIKNIRKLKSTPERNKTYTLQQQLDIFKYLKSNQPILLLFVKFISYNFLRPIEVCRLKVKDIDLKEKKLYVRAKNKVVKTKIIPDILLKELNLEKLNPNDYLFNRDTLGGQWDAVEGSKRDYYTKQFKIVKDEFGLGKEYGLYSFRHTFITKLYHQFSKSMTPAETKGRLMLITGHSTLKALESYLRDLDAEMPEDYSKFL